jgi:hypothetical protein
MHRLIFCLILVVTLGAGPAAAANFLGAPLPPDGQTRSATEQVMEVVVPMSVAQVEEFYKQAFKSVEGEIYFRQRGGISQIEEYGARPWHKITVAAQPDGGSLVTVTKDSWTWIITMLCFRFLGVFVVLLVLYVALKVATSLIMMSERKAEAATR